MLYEVKGSEMLSLLQLSSCIMRLVAEKCYQLCLLKCHGETDSSLQTKQTYLALSKLTLLL